MLSLVTHWARVDDAELGRPKLSGQEEANPLAVPMMLLYVIDEVCRDDEELRQSYCEDEEWAVQQILKHLQVNSNTSFSLLTFLRLVTQPFFLNESMRDKRERSLRKGREICYLTPATT